VDLTSSLPRSAADPGSLVFWLDPDDRLSALLQWTHLGWYSNVQTFGEFGLPFLEQQSADRLTRRTPRYLIALSTDPARIRSAESALVTSGLPVVDSSIRVYERGRFRVEALIVELEPATCDAVPTGEPTPWTGLAPC
jgi:hypothetical protein